MTGSIMRCWKRLADLSVGLMLAFLIALTGVAHAAEIDLRNIQIQPVEDSGFALSVDLAFEFGPRLEEAVGKGLALYFVAEFELTRPRWYWFDEKVVQARQTWRLTYHALTRQYRLSTGGVNQSFTSLDEALRALSRIYRWPFVERDRLLPGDTLDASLRVRLDTSQLPKPFQVEALSNKDWILSSDWKRWSFTVPMPSVSAGGGDTK